MEYANRRFSESEESLLERAKGSKLLSIDAVLAAPPDNSWNTVRLHFDGFDIDVNNLLHDITVDELGTVEEFGLLSVTESCSNTLEIPEVGADTSTFPIEGTIREVLVYNDVVEIRGDGVLVARVEYPQAVAFVMDSGTVMLDKEVWFSEMIAIKQGDDPETMLYDESVNWEDDPEEDPTTHFEFRVERQEL